MIAVKNQNFHAVAEDLVERRFIIADTANYSASVSAVKHATASTDKPFGVTTADADKDSGVNGELVQYEPLIPGYEYSVEAGEAIAVGELVCPAATGLAHDADAATDVVLGTCTRAASASGKIFTFICDANFSSVVA